MIKLNGDRKKGIPPCPRRKHQTDFYYLNWLFVYYQDEYQKIARKMHWITATK